MSDDRRRIRPVFVQPNMDGSAVDLSAVRVNAKRTPLIKDIEWNVQYGQHWVLLGRNGAGKTTVLSVAATQRFPSAGTATVLGHRMGTVDLRDVRTYIGLVSPKQRLPDSEEMPVYTVTLTGHSGSVLPLWERYDDEVRERAWKYLDLVGCTEIADRPIGVCSQGERARVRLARALLAEPLLLLLDEPFAGLDLPAREDLLAALNTLMSTREDLATVTVTHHLEEIPTAATHAMMLSRGETVAAGPIEECITEHNISRCFERDMELHRINGRWIAQNRATAR